VALPLLGHAEGYAVRVALHAVHVIGAGAWLGTLSVVVIAVRDKSVRRVLLSRFAPVAWSSAAALAVAGVVMSWWYVGAWSNLWTTSYGETLALKSGLVGGIAACGFVNWQTLRRQPMPNARWRSIVVVEMTLALLVVMVTSVLTETGHP
jgi:putative copper export protein